MPGAAATAGEGEDLQTDIDTYIHSASSGEDSVRVTAPDWLLRAHDLLALLFGVWVPWILRCDWLLPVTPPVALAGTAGGLVWLSHPF